MTYQYRSIRLLDRQGAILEQLFIEEGDDALVLTSDDEAAALGIATAFVMAGRTVDVSQPITESHERLLAKSAVDVAVLVLKDPSIAAIMPRLAALQINPCPAIPLSTVLDLVDRHHDTQTAASARDILSGRWGGEPGIHFTRPTGLRPQ